MIIRKIIHINRLIFHCRIGAPFLNFIPVLKPSHEMMKFTAMRSKLFLVPIVLTLVHANFCHAQQIVITPDKPNGIYQVGDTVHWRVQWTGQTDAPSAHY